MDILILPLAGFVIIVGVVAWAASQGIFGIVNTVKPGWLNRPLLLPELVKHGLPIVIAIVFSVLFPKWILIAIGLDALETVGLTAFIGGKIIVGILGGVLSGWCYHLVVSLIKARIENAAALVLKQNAMGPQRPVGAPVRPAVTPPAGAEPPVLPKSSPPGK